MATETDNARNQAKAQLESIQEMLERLHHAQECSNRGCGEHNADYDADAYHDEEAAREAVQEDALSVVVRSGWTSPGDPLETAEYLILLCTGGPAVRIVGELWDGDSPDSAHLQYQDWGTPWTEYILDSYGYRTLLDYAVELLGIQEFYFGS